MEYVEKIAFCRHRCRGMSMPSTWIAWRRYPDFSIGPCADARLFSKHLAPVQKFYPRSLPRGHHRPHLSAQIQELRNVLGE
jgi:hypothetical protein